MNDMMENGAHSQPSQLESGGTATSAAAATGTSTSSASGQSQPDLLDQFSAPDLDHSALNQVNLNLNDLNDSTINLNNSNGSLDLGSININFALADASLKGSVVASPKKTSAKKRKLDELAFENISDSESAGSNSSKESKAKDMKYASSGADFNDDFFDAAAASSLLDADKHADQENGDAADQANSNEQTGYQPQQPMSNRVASPAFNHQLHSPYMMQHQNGAAQTQSPGCGGAVQQQQQQQQASPLTHQPIQSPMQAKPPTPHANQSPAAHYHRQFEANEAGNLQGVPPHHGQQQQQQPQHHHPPPPPPPSHQLPPQPIFVHVFTTQIANEAAQSVTRQHHRSIIDFHRNMPATIDFMRNFHHHHHHHQLQQQQQQQQQQQMRPNGAAGIPLPVPNEHLTVEQLKTRTEKLGKLKNLSSIIGIGGGGGGGGQMPPEPGAKRARSSNTPGQVPGSGAPSPFTANGDIYPIEPFNASMMNYGSQAQQQGPPPPYALKPKMHKAGMPEKYSDKLKSQSPGDSLNTGLQTTPSPQLMNYFELEGQELTITKQLNLSFKSNGGGGGGTDEDKHLARPPSAQNSNIINCLNGSSPNDDSDNVKHHKSNNDTDHQFHHQSDSVGEHSRKTPGINKSLSNSQLDYYSSQSVNSPHNNNNTNANPNPNTNTNSQSPAMNGASGPLNQMLQMTNSIPKASPYSNAKSPGLNHPQFSAGSHPQMSSSPSAIIQQQAPPGIPPHILMQQQQQHQQQQQGVMPPMAPIKNGKMSKKQQQQMQQQQQQQQEMMQRGMMMEGMGPPPPHHGMHRGPPPPPHMIPPHMLHNHHHAGMPDPRLMGPRFPPQNAANFRPMRAPADPDMFPNGPPPPAEFMPADFAKHRSKSRQNEMMPNGIMMNGPPPPPHAMMQMINNAKYPNDQQQQMYAPGPPPPPHHNEFGNGPPRPMHPMHMGARPPMEPGMMMPNGMAMMRPMHPNQPFDMPPPPHHIQYANQAAMHNQQSQNAQQNYDNNNYNPGDQQNQVLPQMLQNSGNQQSQHHQQQQQQQQQSHQEINSLQQQMGLGPGPGGDSLGFPDLTDPILQFGD